MLLSSSSTHRLEQVDPRLQNLVRRASILIPTPHEFVVLEGLRTQQDQRRAYARQVSKLNGLPTTDRYADGTQGTGLSPHQSGRAVDLVPTHDGQPRWEWSLIYPVASAMRQASLELRVPLRWGAVYDRSLTDLVDLSAAVSSYVIRHGSHEFLDSPHYELIDA